MLKNISNLGKTLNKVEKQSIQGGAGPKRGNCNGYPNGTRCNYNGHPGCPGTCYNNDCIPW